MERLAGTECSCGVCRSDHTGLAVCAPWQGLERYGGQTRYSPEDAGPLSMWLSVCGDRGGFRDEELLAADEVIRWGPWGGVAGFSGDFQETVPWG